MEESSFKESPITLRFKINALLRTLSPKSLKDLEEALKYKLITANNVASKLLQSWRRLNPTFDDHSGLDYAILFKRIYTRHQYDEKLWKSTLSSLYQAIQLFIAIKQLKNDKVQIHYYNATYLNTHPESGTFRKELKQFDRNFKKLPDSRDKFYQAFRLSWLEWTHYSTNRHDPEVFQNLLRTYYHHHKLMGHYLNCFSNSVNEWMTFEQPNDLVGEADFLLGLYAALEALCREEKLKAQNIHDYFLEFKERAESIDPVENESILRILINLCIREAHKGENEEFAKALFALVEWSTQHTKLLTNRWLATDDDFLNVALTFGNIGQLDRMFEFIQNYGEKLDAHLRESAVALAKAYAFYFSKKPQEALYCLNQVAFQALKYSVRYYSLLLRVTYEVYLLNQKIDMAEVEDTIDRCIRFFRRKRNLTKNRRQQYLNLCYYVQQMAKVCTLQLMGRKNIAAKMHQKLTTSLDGSKTPMAKNWVSDQLSLMVAKL